MSRGTVIVDLRIYEPVLTGAGLLGHFRPEGGDWRRSIRAMGGFWQGSLMVRSDAADLVSAFANWLGGHVQEITAGVTWEGLIYEMELSHKGTRRRRSLGDLANAVGVSYQDAGEITTETFSMQAQSIARYGRREEILAANNVPTATAQALRARYLAGHAWPWARPVALAASGETLLEVRACGYAFTANWLYVQAGDGAEHDVDHWIEAIVGTAEGLSPDHGGSTSGAGDCQFLSAGNVASNTLQVREETQSDVRAWSLIEELAGLGNSSGDLWRAWADVGRKLHYQPVDLSPRYYQRQGGLYDTAGGRMAVNPWTLRPGVVRDMGYPVRRSEPGSMLADARDLYVEEVEVSADGMVSLKTARFDEADLLAAQAARQDGGRGYQEEA